MRRTDFNGDWQVKQENDQHTAPNASVGARLPHDAMFTTQRDEKAWNGTKKAFFANGVWEYTKKFDAPINWQAKHVVIEFEGVYSQSMVYINGSFAGQRPYGYSEFTINADKFLRYDHSNEIKVIARTGDDSRWYSGAGIYRNVNLIVGDQLHIPVNGVRISTPVACGDKAVVCVETQTENLSAAACVTARLKTELFAPDGTLAGSDVAPVTLTRGEADTVSQRIYIAAPSLWNVDAPALYKCKSTLLLNGEEKDTDENRFGIRSLTLDNVDGLQINGQTVKLRGCCIHHDNGPIGARTFAAAEYRKIKKLKEAGFNAIRSAHHPASRAALNACDELGMLVMDEAFDMWALCKSSNDYALYFPTWWEKDIEAMVAKDFNHPSIVLYSIGNEIPDLEKAHGAQWGRKIAHKVHSLDSTRFTTSAVNGMLYILDVIQDIMATMPQNTNQSGDINATMSNVRQGMQRITLHPEVGRITEEIFSSIDVSGYNYMVDRYIPDHVQYPNRIIVGSETFTADIPHIWRLVQDNGHVIGDFTWTGWDYLGETGIGKMSYNNDSVMKNFAFYGDYPWITGWCGDIDITGFRLPASYYREIVYGLRTEPYIAVQRPEHYGEKPAPSPWSWSNAVGSWSWNGFEGKLLCVEVYSQADEVELTLNGKVVDRKPAGEANGFKAEFDTVYQPGSLTAVAYTNGSETGRYSLNSAGNDLVLKVEAERKTIQANGQDLAYVNIELTDKDGVVHITRDRKVTVSIEGEGELIGFGSGSPLTTESYLDGECTTFNGRALAVILPTLAGTIKLTASAEECKPVSVEILAK